MRQDSLSKHFEAIGARVKFGPLRRPRWPANVSRAPYTIDIKRDSHGPFFDFGLTDKAPEFEVLQVVPKERHLLLFTSEGERFLCGHDERHWFVAELTEAVSTVRAAKRALMPAAILERAGSINPSKLDNRRNVVFKRQGEWFFVPAERDLTGQAILRNEPLRRNGRSKSHWCEELVRIGGETVYLVEGQMYTEHELRQQVRRQPSFRFKSRETRVANAEVYVRGHVSHPDHATIKLEGWHRVMINRERPAGHSSRIVFLD
jgi:hypothetical protein